MKEGLSITTIFQIVILFILLFTAIMALTINNSNAFGIKDQIINVIEANNGNYLSENGEELSDEIIDLISKTSYRTTGHCDEGYTGYQRNGTRVNSNEEASVCIREVAATSEIDSHLSDILGDGLVATEDFIPGKYYQVVVFFQLDLPVVKQIYNFQTKAETKIIYDK